MLEKTNRINYLYDFYQALLTPKQRDYMEMYFVEDYSLGEISDLSLVSRQAVYDNIKRTEKMLETYENKLHLYEKFMQRATLIEKLEKLVPDNESNLLNMINQLKELD
ncbi:putative DNA-binding protein [Virgibacillus sp. CBA3643]|uniref:putative DNA-binding protein n=1 Tax=Virgibacillus sp. CBA3643 TaxID=2942278 RepID=UPI0035A33DF5